MDFQRLMGVLNSPNGLAKVMMEDAFENEAGETFSQAELIADVVNSERMDIKRLAQAVNGQEGCADVRITIDQMTPDRAAELLQGIAKGDDHGLIEVFDKLEDQRLTLLAALDGEDAVGEFLTTKQQALFTTPTEPDISAEDALNEN